MNKLPKYWVVKNDNSQLFKDTVIKYLNKFYKYWIGNNYTFYGYDGSDEYNGTACYNSIYYFDNTPKLLTIEEFIELSKEESILKELEMQQFTKQDWINGKCAIEWEEENRELLLQFFKECYNSPSPVGTSKYYYAQGSGDWYATRETTLPIVKIKQLLKQTNMEKEIIGYKLKEGHEKFIPALDKISYTYSGGTFMKNSPFYHHFKEAGVLDLWFEPIYSVEEEYKVEDWVIVLDTPNVRKFNSSGIGHIFRIRNDDFYFKEFIKGNASAIEPNNKYLTNYLKIDVRKATEKEIEQHLISEAEKKGFKKGVKIKTPAGNIGILTGFRDFVECSKNFNGPDTTNSLRWWVSHDTFDSMNLYCDEFGWSEIIASYPEITINGYKGEFFDNYVKFGCATISKQLFIDLYESDAFKETHDYGNKEIESVTIGKGTFTKDQIKEIATYYLEK